MMCDPAGPLCRQVFVLTVWFWEFYMLPSFLALLMAWNYLRLGSGRNSNDLVSAPEKPTTEKSSRKWWKS